MYIGHQAEGELLKIINNKDLITHVTTVARMKIKEINDVLTAADNIAKLDISNNHLYHILCLLRDGIDDTKIKFSDIQTEFLERVARANPTKFVVSDSEVTVKDE